MSAPWFALIVSLASFLACSKTPDKSPRRDEPAAAPASAPAPAPPNASADRSNDPAFALREIDGTYVGRVAAQCPWGATTQNSTQVLPPLDAKDYKLVDNKLEIKLAYGGCPRWTGYTVVTGTGSPLPFYVCHEIQHDTCEMAGTKTWVFDISKQLAASKANAVTFGVPDGVH